MTDLLAYAFLAATFGSFGSRLKHNPLDHPPKEAFHYRGYDGAEKLIIKGWLVIIVENSKDVIGEWCLDRVGDPDNTGPQIGLGGLRGHLEGTQLAVNLNPGFADFNVFLSGTFDGASFKGRWRYSTVRGAMNEGAFEAVRPEKEACADLNSRI